MPEVSPYQRQWLLYTEQDTLMPSNSYWFLPVEAILSFFLHTGPRAGTPQGGSWVKVADVCVVDKDASIHRRLHGCQPEFALLLRSQVLQLAGQPVCRSDTPDTAVVPVVRPPLPKLHHRVVALTRAHAAHGDHKRLHRQMCLLPQHVGLE
mmetsp:Transcript_23078/g.64084  ORF Transcript_23078/g.64084 Transcript_23078/m.64084 type:complete len:151 (-) Transcript_23078:655-1107(-)